MQPKVIKYYYYLANELADLEKQGGDVRILYTTNKEAYANSSDVDGNIAEGEVVTIPWGGNVNIQYYKGKFVTADNRIATSNDINYLLNKYLYYWMLSQKGEIEKMYRGAGIKHPSMLSVLSMQIAIPPLQEQNRIVGILDTFTSSIDNLKQQIALRRKQYEYYRDQLLDLEGKDGVEMKALGLICKLERGIRVVKKELQQEGVIPVYQNSLTPLGYYEKSNYPEKTPFVICAGAAGEIGYSNIPFWAADDCTCVLCPSSIIGKYIYIYLLVKQHSLKSQVRKASVPRLSKDVIGKLLIPVPPISEQQWIVDILDKFEASIQNLEAQLSQREKQYEYYRNKLLTFE